MRTSPATQRVTVRRSYRTTLANDRWLSLSRLRAALNCEGVIGGDEGSPCGVWWKCGIAPMGHDAPYFLPLTDYP
jgi:hypothetical protein